MSSSSNAPGWLALERVEQSLFHLFHELVAVAETRLHGI